MEVLGHIFLPGLTFIRVTVAWKDVVFVGVELALALALCADFRVFSDEQLVCGRIADDSRKESSDASSCKSVGTHELCFVCKYVVKGCVCVRMCGCGV